MILPSESIQIHKKKIFAGTSYRSPDLPDTTCLTKHHLLPLTNSLDFSYQITRYLDYEE